MSQSNEHSTSELFTNICDIKGKHRVGKLFDHGDVFNMLERALERPLQSASLFLSNCEFKHFLV